jgi:glyoxylase I family protein
VGNSIVFTKINLLKLISKETIKMQLNKIHHVAIICSDYDKSKDFYVNVLGLTVLKETYRESRNSYKLDLQVGGLYQIELFSFPQPAERPSYPEAMGLRHLAFEVDDLEVAAEELKSKNISVEEIRIDPITDKKFTFFVDPDGLPLELYEK